MELIAIFFFLGGCSGFLAGLLGIGGGVISVPALYYILSWKGHPIEEVMQIAIATSLASVVLTTAISTWTYYQKKMILYRALGYLLPGLIIGCIIGCISGAQLVSLLSGDTLRMIFGSMAVAIGIYFTIPALPILKIADQPNPLLTFFGLIIGHLSSLLGVGGGIFSVPLLFAYRIPPKNIAATSSAATMTTSLVGTLTYLVMATQVPHLSTEFGYIDFSAFLWISIGSAFSVRFGVKLAQYLSVQSVKRIFGIVLSATGIFMIFR
jgi:uncharacterized membrane protein YfcA